MRDRGLRFVLIVGVLTTVATSAPEGFFLVEDASRDLPPLEVAHVTVVFGAGTLGDGMGVTFDLEGEPGTVVMIVPDDPSVPAFEISELGDQRVDVLALCPTVPCEVGFSIDPAEGSGNLRVEAESRRAGDASFCFPDNRSYAEGATIQVIFD
jgi:hypothetical protein